MTKVTICGNIKTFSGYREEAMWKTLVSMRAFFVGLLVVGCFIALFIATLGRTLDFVFSGNTLCAIINGGITAIFFALILIAGFFACQMEDKEPSPPARSEERFFTTEEFCSLCRLLELKLELSSRSR
ncbi:MAG: hypothetical protein NTY11_02460 [Candidatus Parcubacteria bacterium]|nr:hypothetical protein [Candidatus Parcubacteria bacterium]